MLTKIMYCSGTALYRSRAKKVMTNIVGNEFASSFESGGVSLRTNNLHPLKDSPVALLVVQQGLCVFS